MAMTTLQAVNAMLQMIGHPPVSALDTGGSSIQGEAERILDGVRAQVLRTGPGDMGGWWCNTIPSRTHSPNGVTNYIDVSDALVVAPTEGSVGLKVVKRGSYLYDLENETYEFDADVTLKVVETLSFVADGSGQEAVPDLLQDYIVAKATWDFVNYKRPGAKDMAIVAENLRRARTQAIQEHQDQRRLGMLDTNPMKSLRGSRYEWNRYV